jgi:hypothetical protein
MTNESFALSHVEEEINLFHIVVLKYNRYVTLARTIFVNKQNFPFEFLDFERRRRNEAKAFETRYVKGKKGEVWK